MLQKELQARDPRSVRFCDQTKYRRFHPKIEWDLKDPYISCDRATRYSGCFGAGSVGPVGDFLDSCFFVVFFGGGIYYNVQCLFSKHRGK